MSAAVVVATDTFDGVRSFQGGLALKTFLHFLMVVFLACLSAVVSAIAFFAMPDGWAWSIVALWALAVVAGRLTLALIRDRPGEPKKPARSVSPLASAGAALGTGLGLVFFQGFGPSVIATAACGLFLAFVTGLMLVNPYGQKSLPSG